MRSFLIVLFVLSVSTIYAQIYVDSGIQHYHKGEYDEALSEFKNAMELKDVLTENAIAKIYYFRGRTWLAIAEQAKGNYQEIDPIANAFDDLIKVKEHGNQWGNQLDDILSQLNSLLIDEADSYLKQEKKAKRTDEKMALLNQRINYLKQSSELDVSSMVNLYLGQTNKQVGDLIFETTANVTEMQRAKDYYLESLKYYELARYDDPFSKDIIQDLLTISKRLGDVDRIAEYEKLLKLAGG